MSVGRSGRSVVRFDGGVTGRVRYGSRVTGTAGGRTSRASRVRVQVDRFQFQTVRYGTVRQTMYDVGVCCCRSRSGVVASATGVGCQLSVVSGFQRVGVVGTVGFSFSSVRLSGVDGSAVRQFDVGRFGYRSVRSGSRYGTGSRFHGTGVRYGTGTVSGHGQAYDDVRYGRLSRYGSRCAQRRVRWVRCRRQVGVRYDVQVRFGTVTVSASLSGSTSWALTAHRRDKRRGLARVGSTMYDGDDDFSFDRLEVQVCTVFSQFRFRSGQFRSVSRYSQFSSRSVPDRLPDRYGSVPVSQVQVSARHGRARRSTGCASSLVSSTARAG